MSSTRIGFIAGVCLALVTTAVSATPLEVQWSTPQSVSSQGTNATRPSIALSVDGSRLSAVWTQSSEVWGAASDDSGASWSTPTRISASSTTTDYPQIAASDDGLKANAIWYTFSPTEAVTTASSTDGGKTWGNRVTRVLGIAAGNPQIAGSADGTRIAAVWAYDNPTIRVIEVSSSSNSGVIWAPPEPISDVTKNAGDPQVAMSADGSDVVVAYSETDGTNERVRVRRSTDGGENWNASEVLSEEGEDAGSPQVAVSADGARTYVLWTRTAGTDRRVQITTQTGSGPWTAPINLSEAGQDASATDLSISANGLRATAVWQRSDSAHQRIQSSSTQDGAATWTSPETHSASGSTADNPRVATSSEGDSVTLAWYRQDPGNNVIEVVSSADAGQTWGTVTPLSDNAQPAQDPDLAGTGDGRDILVAWDGSDGTDNRIWASTGLLRTVPDAPTSTVATAGDAQVTVSWTPPADDGGSPITNYTAVASPGGQSCTTAATSCSITGLANGTTYTVRVSATNTIGTGPASAASNPVTPMAPPPPATPAPTPTPEPTPEPESTKVKAKANDAKSKLKVTIKPDLGKKKQWEFVIKVKKKGDWKTIKTKKDKTKVYETEGSDHKLTVDLDEGKYKAKSKESRGYLADTSDVVKLKK